MSCASLPPGWLKKRLGDCCDIVSGGTPSRDRSEYWDGDIAWVTPKDISDLDDPIFTNPPERITELGLRKSSAALLPKGAILLSSRAPIGLVAIAGRPMATNQGFKSLVPRPGLDGNFLYHAIKRMVPEIAARGNGATFKEVSKAVLSEIELAYPQDIRRQKQIAKILDKADGVGRKRNRLLTISDTLLHSAFLDLFGDPVTNPKRLLTLPLVEVAKFVSGGTPSKSRKEFWEGEFPWVSPKDMKRVVIDDAQDHLSESAFSETNLKKIAPNTVLIVVRGMILAHTVPIGITTREVAINQDMKAVLFHKKVNPYFGLWCLKVQHRNLLSKIDTAAHGTKRFDMDRLERVPILVPGPAEQAHFAALVERFSMCHSNLEKAVGIDETFRESLIQRAFRGEL
jgi:type I restriction enzyme S subunit